MANKMVEPTFIQSQWFHMLAFLTITPQHHMCILDENQILKSCIKLHYHKFLAHPPHTMRRSVSKNAGAQLHLKTYHTFRFQVSSFVGFVSQHSPLHTSKISYISVKLNHMHCKQGDFV